MKTIRYKACTTGCCGKDATVYGAPMTFHSNDDELGDHSICYIPPADHENGATRKVYLSADALGSFPIWNCHNTPRLNTSERGSDYNYYNEYPQSIPLGSIPQVKHTYGYLDGAYAIANEKGLSFGECTNGTIFQCGPTDADDASGDVKRLFYSAELSRVAAERCVTARDAIKLMGNLIETYGYYGTGECLPLADKTEAWVFEMAPSKSGRGGYWAAKRVPDNAIFWAANECRIRTIYKTTNSNDNFCGQQIFDELGRDKISLDWLKSVSEGEYNHPYYSLRRVWRAFSLTSPSLKLSPYLENGLDDSYPFAAVPDKQLKLSDIFAIYRDHYEGTEFDLTKLGTVDAFGNPNRYNTNGFDLGGDVGPAKDLKGAWERPISHYYTGYSYVNVSDPNKNLGLDVICWISLNVPGESVYIPLSVAKTPESYKKVSSQKFDIDKAWWTYNRVAEEVYKKYFFMKPELAQYQEPLEKDSQTLLNFLQSKNKTPEAIQVELTLNANNIQSKWKDLWYKLIVKYNQGFKYENDEAFTLGYPEEWLINSKWKDGPTTYSQKN
jgi:dipeptidase